MNASLTLLSIGSIRSTWPRDLARWSTSGLLAVEHHPCLTPDELDDRLAAAGAVDIVLIDGSLPETGRDLLRRAAVKGSAVLVVDDQPRGWVEMGATAVTPPPEAPEPLQRLLEQLRPDMPARPRPARRTSRPGQLVAVTGHGGAGTSTVAQGLAARWATADPDHDVVLADLSLGADQHVHHDLHGVGSGVLDLAAGHTHAAMSAEAVRNTAHPVVDGYHLLTGVGHPRDWTALPPMAVDAVVAGLLDAFDVVVADVDDDLEGRTETGSFDVEERHGLARTAVAEAQAVVVVCRADLLGLHRLCRHIEALLSIGVDHRRIRPVASGCTRRTPAPIALRRDIERLLGHRSLAAPLVTVRHLRGLESRRRDGRLPSRALTRALAPLDPARGETAPVTRSADAEGPEEQTAVHEQDVGVR